MRNGLDEKVNHLRSHHETLVNPEKLYGVGGELCCTEQAKDLFTARWTSSSLFEVKLTAGRGRSDELGSDVRRDCDGRQHVDGLDGRQEVLARIPGLVEAHLERHLH